MTGLPPNAQHILQTHVRGRQFDLPMQNQVQPSTSRTHHAPILPPGATRTPLPPSAVRTPLREPKLISQMTINELRTMVGALTAEVCAGNYICKV